jgi:hypothetical protein
MSQRHGKGRERGARVALAQTDCARDWSVTTRSRATHTIIVRDRLHIWLDNLHNVVLGRLGYQANQGGIYTGMRRNHGLA